MCKVLGALWVDVVAITVAMYREPIVLLYVPAVPVRDLKLV